MNEKRTFSMQWLGDYIESDVSSSCKARDFKDGTDLAAVDCRNLNESEAVSGTLQSKNTGGYSLNYTNPVRRNNQVRRLTPLECTRLQGFPDGWVDIGDWEDTKGRLHKEADAPKYKALGNSIAIPFWEWMARRMVEVLKRDGVEHPTMCSLFDGIGGFPLSFKRAGCEPVWASEIEEFPIAVTKRRFPEPSKPVSRLPSGGHGEEVKTARKAPLRARGGVLALNDQGGGGDGSEF